MNTELPEGWTECAIGEIAEVTGGGTPDAANPENFSEVEGVPWLTPADLSGFRGIYVSHGRRFLTPAGFEASAARKMPKGTVLFSSRAPIGYVAVAQNEITTNQGFKSFVCREHVDPEFLYFYLRFAKPFAEELASGTTFAEISGRNAARIPLRLPPFMEQKRIARGLKAVTEGTYRAEDRLARIPPLLRRLRQAILAAACDGRLTVDWRERTRSGSPKAPATNDEQGLGRIEPIVDVPASWKWVRLASLCESGRAICYGVIKLGPDVAGGVPCLRTSDVKALRINIEGVKQIAPAISAGYSRTVLRSGEVLVNVRGTLGGVAVVPSEMRGWNVSREIAIVPLAEVSPQFVSYWIANVATQNWLTGVARGVAYTGINIEDLRLLPVAVPPPAEQREIARRVDGLLKLADRIEAGFKKAQATIAKLTPSLLASAFRGELVPTEAELAAAEGRAYETATALLERIRQGVGSPSHSAGKKPPKSAKQRKHRPR